VVTFWSQKIQHRVKQADIVRTTEIVKSLFRDQNVDAATSLSMT